MDEQTRQQLKNEIMALKAMVPSAASHAAGLQQSAYPVTGTVVNIQSLPMAALAIRAQNDCILKLVTIVEKLLDA